MSLEVPTRSGAPFVGRTGELQQLETALSGALAGRGGVALVAGEPGIGKSRLTDEFTRRAESAGARVLWGRCWEAGGAPPYWPWVQALRACVRTTSPETLRGLATIGIDEIADIVPEVRTAFPDRAWTPRDERGDPESARFRLFDAVSSFLGGIAAAEPIVVAIEDLHAADEPSLLMLSFVAAQAAGTRLLIVASYRDVAMARDDPLSVAVSEVGRLPSTIMIRLTGLSETDTRRLVEETRREVDPAVAAALHAETAGNPLFIEESMRLLETEGRLAAGGRPRALPRTLPRGIGEAIGRRLDYLPEDCRRLLRTASVLGREFSLETLARLEGEPIAALLERLGDALAGGIVEQDPNALGRLRFGHELVRETLYALLPPAARLELHGRAGEVLEHLHRSNPEEHLAELAHHFVLAAPAGDVSKAVTFARAAGDRAARQLGYEEAVRLYGMALQALDLLPEEDPAARGELLLSLGDALGRAGDIPAAKETFLAAAALAKRLDHPDALARAALGYSGRLVYLRALKDTRMIPLLEEALSLLPDDDSVLRASLLARLSGALRDERSPERRDRLSLEAVEMARRLGDPDTLAYALNGRLMAIWNPDTIEQRRALADEMIATARQVGNKEREMEGLLGRLGTLVDTGDMAEAAAVGLEMRRLAEEIRQPTLWWMPAQLEAALTMFTGDYERGEELMDAAHEVGRRVHSVDAISCYRMQLFLLLRERGRVGEIEALMRRTAEDFPSYQFFDVAVALILLELGRRDEAARVVHALAADDFGTLHYDNEWLFTMTLLTEAIQRVGAPDLAARAYDRLHPFAHLNGFALAEGATGAVTRYLGLLATVLGRVDDAVSHLEAAVEMNERMGSRPFAAHARRDLAVALLMRDAPGDRDRAERLHEEAARSARDLGMTVLASSIEETGARVAGPPRPERARAATLRREGEYWALAFDGDSFRLKHSKGLEYLARLVEDPGREFHALDLVAGDGEGPPPAEDALSVDSGGGAGPALDARAKTAYRRRLEDLEAEIEDADSVGDAERAARAREERDAIAAELASAMGLGGRDRPSASAAERARLNVTRAIRSALGRISEHSAGLGTHLDRSIRTGTFCVYLPDPGSGVTWRL